MAVSAGFRSYLADVLGDLGKIETKRVFGLDGLKADGVLLGFIIDERVYFRTDDASRAAYVDVGSKPFSFTKRTGELIVTSYYSLPERLYDEPEEFLSWARKARAAALESPSARKRRADRARGSAKTMPDRKRPRPKPRRGGRHHSSTR